MKFIFEGRSSDSPLVEGFWRTQSEGGGSFMSVAECHWGMVVTRQAGKITLTVRGPETKASPAPVPEDADFFGIIFKLGTFMPQLPAKILVDDALNLPEATSQSFYLHGSAWEFPTYDNADIFVERMVRKGLLMREPVVDAALQGQLDAVALSLRSVQRRFLQVTGLTHGAIRQIERARHAQALLQQGHSILDTVELAGYADQPHLTRTLKRLVGQTPAEIVRLSRLDHDTPSEV